MRTRLIHTVLSIFLSFVGTLVAQQPLPERIHPVDPVKAFDKPQLGIQLIESSRFIRAPEARAQFNVNGSGLTAAVLDTGLRVSHVDFRGRVPAQKNFTTDNGGNENDASDGHGHGTNVAGIVAANDIHIGIAPGANVIPIKVLDNNGGGSFETIQKGLQWCLDNHAAQKIVVVNMSLGNRANYQDDNFGNDELHNLIKKLRDQKVAVVVSAGNWFHTFQSAEEMSYPAIFRETVSVGAVYDANEGPFSYSSGATAFSTDAGRITPFSQRLHPTTQNLTRTDIFAPGAPVTSAGHTSDQGESIQHGTSQAAPVTAGVILLMQQYHLRTVGTLATVDQIEEWLRQGAVTINDGDDEDDNVIHTGKDFLRLDALNALEAVRRGIRKDLLLGVATESQKQPVYFKGEVYDLDFIVRLDRCQVLIRNQDDNFVGLTRNPNIQSVVEAAIGLSGHTVTVEYSQRPPQSIFSTTLEIDRPNELNRVFRLSFDERTATCTAEITAANSDLKVYTQESRMQTILATAISISKPVELEHQNGGLTRVKLNVD